MIKATVKYPEYLFPKGATFYLSECTNGIINGYHIFVNADRSGGITCNISYEQAKRIFDI